MPVRITSCDTPSAQVAATAASTFSDLGTLPGKIQERQTVADPYWQIWILLILFLLLASWYFLHRKKRAAPDFPEIAEAIPNGNS